MEKYCFLVLVFVVTVFGSSSSVDSSIMDSKKECLVDIMDKAVQPSFLQDLCQMTKTLLICGLNTTTQAINASTIQTMQNMYDTSPQTMHCHLNATEIVEAAKNPTLSIGDDQLSPESIARRRALRVCMDDLFAKSEMPEYQQDPCKLDKELIPCFVHAMSPNGVPSEEAIQSVQMGLKSQGATGCNYDVRGIILDFYKQPRDCFINILDKALLPKYQDDPCPLAKESLVCHFKPSVYRMDFSEYMKPMQDHLDSISDIWGCRLNFTEVMDEAKKPSEKTDDDGEFATSVAQRQAVGQCWDIVSDELKTQGEGQDPCPVQARWIPCIANALSPNAAPSNETILALKITVHSQALCNFDVEKILKDASDRNNNNNATPASFSRSFWSTLVISTLSVFILAPRY